MAGAVLKRHRPGESPRNVARLSSNLKNRVLTVSLETDYEELSGDVVPNAAVEWIFRDGTASGASSAGGGGSNLVSAAGADGTAETTWRLGHKSGSQLATARLQSGGHPGIDHH